MISSNRIAPHLITPRLANCVVCALGAIVKISPCGPYDFPPPEAGSTIALGRAFLVMLLGRAEPLARQDHCRVNLLLVAPSIFEQSFNKLILNMSNPV